MTEAAIADHGLIGDLQTAALVSTDGSIDWFCCPRFDSPSVFGALLDDERGGPLPGPAAGADYESKQMYFPDTAVLITRFIDRGRGGRGRRLHDAGGPGGHREPPARADAALRPRRDELRGRHRAAVRLRPQGAPDGADRARRGVQHRRPDADPARGAGARRRAAGPRPRRGGRRAGVARPEGGGRARGGAGVGGAGPPREIRVAEFQQMFDDTVAFWRSWLARSTYTGRWRETLQRSAITLKLMTYAPTGGLVAAPTTGLPEQVGGERNWDYRYTWVRDASFSIYALLRLGFTEESGAVQRVAAGPGGRAGRRRGRPAEHHVPGRRVLRPQGGVAGALVGLPRLAPGPDRQRRLRPAPARHLRRGPGQHLLRRRARPARSGTAAGSRSASSWTGSPSTGTSPRRASGRPAAGARTSPTAGSCAGSRSTAASGWPPRTAVPPPSTAWPAARDAIYDQIMTEGLERGSGGVRPALRQRRARLVAAADVHRRVHRPAGPDVALHAAGDGRRAGHRQPRLPLRPRRVTRRPAGLGGHVLALLVHVRRRARPGRPARRRPAGLREDAHLRQPRRAVLRGDRR